MLHGALCLQCLNHVMLKNEGFRRIIEPLASRCSKFRFKPLDDSSSTNRLEHIALSEQLRVKPDVFSALISTSGGDLRRAITYLQSAARLAAASATETAISPRDIQEIAGTVPDAVINSFARALGVEVAPTAEEEEMDVDMDADRSIKLKGFDLIRDKVRAMMREGYSASQVLTQVSVHTHQSYIPSLTMSFPKLHDIIILHQDLTARQKSKCALVMAEADKALCDGSDEELWVLEVALKVNKAVSS